MNLKENNFIKKNFECPLYSIYENSNYTYK